MTSATPLVLQPHDCLLHGEDPFMPYPTITIWFQALLTSIFWMLFSFPSRYYSAIGLKLYLVLEVDVSQISAGFPTHGTRGSDHDPLVYVYAAITLYAPTFQMSSTSPVWTVYDLPHNTTFLSSFEERFGLNSAVFTRRYSQHLN